MRKTCTTIIKTDSFFFFFFSVYPLILPLPLGYVVCNDGGRDDRFLNFSFLTHDYSALCSSCGNELLAA